MTPQPWVLATRNVGKVRELRPIFHDAGIAVVDLGEAGIQESAEEEGLEVFQSFEANALAKARWFAKRARGRPVIADDSGLEVASLHGAPGVRSKRWSGQSELADDALDAANNALLLQRLGDASDRRARFVCVAAWSDGRREFAARGEVAGTIVQANDAAGTHGFGYDPLFYSSELGMTLAQATVPQKQSISHRGRAFAALLSRLREAGVLQVRARS